MYIFFCPSYDQLLGNSSGECQRLDLIRARDLNANTMEGEGEKGFDSEVRERL